jgi:hypothetical protein
MPITSIIETNYAVLVLTAKAICFIPDQFGSFSSLLEAYLLL